MYASYLLEISKLRDFYVRMADPLPSPASAPDEPASFRVGPWTNSQGSRKWLCPLCDLGWCSQAYDCTRMYLEGMPTSEDGDDFDFAAPRNDAPHTGARKRFWLYKQVSWICQPPPGTRVDLPRCVKARIQYLHGAGEIGYIDN